MSHRILGQKNQSSLCQIHVFKRSAVGSQTWWYVYMFHCNLWKSSRGKKISRSVNFLYSLLCHFIITNVISKSAMVMNMLSTSIDVVDSSYMPRCLNDFSCFDQYKMYYQKIKYVRMNSASIMTVTFWNASITIYLLCIFTSTENWSNSFSM